ncbi:glycosyltransferase family 4 protein [Hymenobacter sp. BT188]|uniref:glycosyltransferase family 4 protein n=1 Tax=Hymenobacter sp. BT188 TaxID=2763504 RepID=UPI0016510EA1|nr:glycosyltransferase family 1 protein [Hymenobacter sp. BT188]MBC6609136.1 glycosyltransferase family 4 protein [Hymenobacter sp. BT188]
MKIILIGNYSLDRLESMDRFAQMLASGFRQAGITTEIWRPVPVFAAGRLSTTTGYRKWLGYLDKWLVFPVILCWRLRGKAIAKADVYFHICDHANAPYLQYLDRKRTAITCHDVLAIRSSLGYTGTHVSTSFFGNFLQKYIFHYLSRAQRLASVSKFTLQQLTTLGAPRYPDHSTNWQVIPNAFNADFTPLPLKECNVLLTQAGVTSSTPFILHVGSNEPRKNRTLLLDMVHILGNRWTGNICFAGETPDHELLSRIDSLGLHERILCVVKPEHAVLVALYSACEAFVFPSYAEGFGWPVIEAQACGAPVIASDIEPMPEVSGGAAIHADPSDPEAFAEALLSLQQPDKRAELVQQGFINCRRFRLNNIIQMYLDLFELD